MPVFSDTSVRPSLLRTTTPRKEAAHRGGPPPGRLDDRRDGCPLPAVEYLDHPGLFRISPTEPGSRSLGVLATSSTDPAGRLVKSEIGRLRGFAGFLGLRLRGALVELDGRKAELGDAQRDWPIVLITAPDRQRACGVDLLDQTFANLRRRLQMREFRAFCEGSLPNAGRETSLFPANRAHSPVRLCRAVLASTFFQDRGPLRSVHTRLPFIMSEGSRACDADLSTRAAKASGA